RMFPGEDAVGKDVYTWGEEPKRVVGIVDPLIRPNDFEDGPASSYLTFIMPMRMPYNGGSFVIRTDPDRREEVLAQAVATLEELNPGRILLADQTFSGT